MAKSGELKDLIVSKIKEEWDDPDEGWDWKDENWWNEEGLAEKMFAKLCNPKNWKRIYKGRDTVGDTEFVIRQFSFSGEEETEGTISAMVTCDKDDNFLDIEFEQQ